MKTLKRCLFAVALLALAGFALQSEAKALRIAIPVPPQPSQLVIQSEVVVIGKIAQIEKDAVQATQFPGQPQKVAYRVASVKLEKALLGAKGLTHIRIGFIPPANPGVPQPEIQPLPIRPIRPFPGINQPNLTEGMEGTFFLKQHHDGDFFILSGYGFSHLDKKNPNFDKEMALVEKSLKTLNDPVSALKVKDLKDRFEAAQLLLQRYNTLLVQPKPGTPVVKNEEIPAEESKLILHTMKELSWFNQQGGPSRSNLWYQLGLNQNDFMQPRPMPGQDFNKIMEEATTKWLTDNADRFRIKRYPTK